VQSRRVPGSGQSASERGQHGAQPCRRLEHRQRPVQAGEPVEGDPGVPEQERPDQHRQRAELEPQLGLDLGEAPPHQRAVEIPQDG